ncbi:hypothetical protein Tco_0689666 [Tanacetum coccineum]
MVAVSDSGRMFGVTMFGLGLGSGDRSLEVVPLMQNLSTLSLKVEIADGWRWILAATGIFTVKKLSHLIDMKLLGSFSLARNHCWNSWVSIKVNVLESTDHIFCECVIVKRILDKCGRWWKVAAPHQIDKKNVVFQSLAPSESKLVGKALQGVMCRNLSLAWDKWALSPVFG